MTRKMKYLFVCSILLNLLLLGVMGGHAMKRMAHGVSYAEAMQETLNTLPLEKASHIKTRLEAMFQKHQESRQIARESRKEAIALLAAEQFDAAAYRQQVEKMHALRGETMQAFASDIATLAETLSQEERKALAEVLRHSPHKRRHCPEKK